MKYYQGNQNETFDREFAQGYLCCPEGNWGGWPLMRELRRGDVVFHYNSSSGAVLGISRIVGIGHHKGAATLSSSVIEGSQCIRYLGQHLSEADFDDRRRQHMRQKYPTYNEVHTAPILRKNLGKLLERTPQVYLLSIDERVAERFLSDHGVRL